MGAAELPRNVAAYRVDYRREKVRGGYDGRLHLAATSAVGVAAIVFCASRVSQVTAAHLLAVPITYVVGNLLEYLGHQRLMHKLVKPLDFLYRRHAAEHHRFFTQAGMAVQSHRDFLAVIFPLKVSLFYMAGIAAPLGLVSGWLFGPNVGWLVGATGAFYYQSYEALHLMAHLPEDSWWGRRGFVAAIRKHHGIHHDPRRMRYANFNITVPLWDWILGTLDTRERVDAD